MATTEHVYNTTTTAQEVKSKKWFVVPSENLDKTRCCIKVLEVLLSLVAFILEEIVTNCTDCFPLYFFEFVSCTAFLFTLLLLVLLTTALHGRVGITCWPKLDFAYTALIMVFFFISSLTFAVKNSGTSNEGAAVTFGFLASTAFLVDAVVFIKMKGFPFCNKPPQNTLPVPESEKLHSNGAE